MKAMDNYNVFLPTGDAKIGNTDYDLDSNSLYDLPDPDGEHPPPFAVGQRLVPQGRRHDEGHVADPDERRADQRQARGVHPGFPAARHEHADRRLARSRTQPANSPRGSPASGIDLKLVMDQSVYVRQSIWALMQEGFLGAVLCSLTILLFLGQFRMTAIAVMTLPISVLVVAASSCITRATRST